MLTIGIVVPCRNEAAILERKLSNLAGLRWPSAERTHRICVVDDGSDDGTGELARELATSIDGAVRLAVVTNEVRPGKPGAIRAGLEELAADVDLVLLTDADVIFVDDALEAVVKAFEEDGQLQMACGAQLFVDRLPEDGRWTEECAHDARVEADLFDRGTARIRRFESRAGKLFSVHGQLLCWRTSLGIEPSFGVAADDLDLMLQVRGRPGARICYLPDACFVEVKTHIAEGRKGQALRRARAYFQAVHGRSAPRGDSFLGRVQWFFYRRVPGAMPLLTLIGAGMTLFVLAFFFRTTGVLIGGAALLLILFSRPGRLWLQLMGVIWRARGLEARDPMSERWEMARR